jgi:hypothetical protein
MGAIKTPRTNKIFLMWLSSQVHNPAVWPLWLLNSLELAGHLHARCLPQLAPLVPIRLKHVPLLGPQQFKVLIHQMIE